MATQPASAFGLTPSPEELDAWASQRGRTTLGYQQGNAQADFSRGNILANRTADYANLKHQFGQMRNQLPQQYSGRGLLNSGVYTQGLQNYGQQRIQAFGDLGRRYQQMLGQSDLNRQQGGQNYFANMADINSQERARRAALAAQIRSI